MPVDLDRRSLYPVERLPRPLVYPYLMTDCLHRYQTRQMATWKEQPLQPWVAMPGLGPEKLQV
jgi:hypothetical protein